MSLRIPIALLVAVACVLSVVPGAARAALGDDLGSVETDRAQLKAALRTSSAADYTVHELTLPGGTVVREFASASGTVFAVSWSGPFMPDLRQLLGAWFERYRVAVPASRTGRARVSVLQPDLIVHSGGHPRAFVGLAYLPQAVPAGVTRDELR